MQIIVYDSNVIILLNPLGPPNPLGAPNPTDA